MAAESVEELAAVSVEESAEDTAATSEVATALEVTLAALDHLAPVLILDHLTEAQDHLLNTAHPANLDHTKPMMTFLPSPILNYLLYIIVFYVSPKYNVTVLQ